MALHGRVQVNTKTLLEWSAVRKEVVVRDDDQVSTYRCTVSNEAGDHAESFDMPHRYGDGPAVLAYKVLREYGRRRPGR